MIGTVRRLDSKYTSFLVTFGSGYVENVNSQERRYQLTVGLHKMEKNHT